MPTLRRAFNSIESVVCRALLVVFVCLLFGQIVSREFFNHSFSWIEELSVYLFVWFVFLGASYAALMSAHNRVTFQFGWLPRAALRWIEAFADLFWIGFNAYFVWLSWEFIGRMNAFQTSQTLGWPMWIIYLILPIAFTLMTIRILQVNWMRLVRGEDPRDPDKIDLEEVKRDMAAGKTDPDGGIG